MTGGAVLLAAGFSRRFGSDKRRHRLPDGTPLLTASVHLYASVFPGLIVVLRPEDGALATQLRPDIPGTGPGVVLCPEAWRGMGHSLACGARAASAAGWRYVFVALADMAWVDPATLRRLVSVMEAGDDATIVQPCHDGVPGHPVGFGAGYFSELQALTGDAGARAVLRNAGDRLRRVEVDDPGVLEDLDSPPEPG